MINYFPKLHLLRSWLHQKQFVLISAEKVLIQENPAKWRKPIAKFYHSDQIKKRLWLEAQGTKQIMAGTYKLQD